MPYLQIALPIALILWLALWPLRGHARAVHMAMTIALIMALILWVPWLWPSAYAPLALAALLALVIAFGRRRPVDRRNPRSWPGVLAGLVAVAAFVMAGWLINQRLRPAETLDLALPFASPAAVTEGGRAVQINRHRAVMDINSPSLTGWRGQADAVTLWPVDHLGRALAAPVPVTAPCAGSIANTGQDTRLGRFLTLDCAGTWVVMSGLTDISASGQIAAGQPIGTGIEITLHAQTPGTPGHPFSGGPLPISLNGTYPVRGWVLRP